MHHTTILDYWFGENVNSADNIATDKQKLWFTGGQEIDREITHLFANALDEAKKGTYVAWENTALSRLALIILLDQFSRNIYRNTKGMYGSDAQSLQLCLTGLEKKMDEELLPIHRQFFYMPLQHAEDLKLQQKSVQMYKKIREDAPEITKDYFSKAVNSATRHCEIIQMFGRFPHRNKILQRESTKEEQEFLQTPNSSF